MLSSISPVGEASRRQRWWLTALAYLVGALGGGIAVGGALGWLGARLLGAMDAELALGLLAVAACAGVLIDLVVHPVRLPSWRRQVDERWLGSYRGWVYGAGYGLQLGAGAVTIVPATTTYVAGLAALLVATPLGGAVVGATFGFARAAPLLLTARVRTTASLTQLMRRVSAARGRARVLTGAGQAAVALAAVVAVVAR